MRSFLFIVLETASRALHYNKAQYACSNKSKVSDLKHAHYQKEKRYVIISM